MSGCIWITLFAGSDWLPKLWITLTLSGLPAQAFQAKIARNKVANSPKFPICFEPHCKSKDSCVFFVVFIHVETKLISV